MKKFILPLLLLLAVGMLVAVESAPSAVVGYVKYDCVVGNNFVAMPMIDGLALTSEVGALYGENINSILVWSPIAQGWDTAVNYGEGYWEPDLEVGPGSVLFFNSTAALSFYSIGSLPTTNAQYGIVVGNNTVMVPLNKSELTLTSEVGATIGDGESVNSILLWSSTAQGWDTAVNYGEGYWEPDLEVSIGTPLFLNSSASTTWPAGPRNYDPQLKTSKK